MKPPSKNSKEKFEYFSRCINTATSLDIPFSEEGYTALECFHHKETFGGTFLPCREPELLIRAINGKREHGLSVTMIAEDYIDRICFTSDIRDNYPVWIQKDIKGRAKQLAVDRVGYVPTFVETGEDFTTLGVF